MAVAEAARAAPESVAGSASLRRRLSEGGWLRGGDPAAVGRLLDLCFWRRYSEGDVIYHADGEAGDLYGVVEGQVAVCHHHQGHVDVEYLHLYRAGQWFGYAPVLRSEHRRIQTVARTACLLAVVPEGRLKPFLGESPEHWRLMALMADAQAQLNGLAALDLVRRAPEQRLAAALLRLTGCRLRDAPDGAPWEIRVSQQELADVSNMSRNAASRLLQGFETAGIVVLHYRQLELLHPARLRRMLDADG